MVRRRGRERKRNNGLCYIHWQLIFSIIINPIQDLKPEDRQLKQYRRIYEQTVQKSGEGAIDALSIGINLAEALKKSNHSIEAERLASKLVIISRRVHGPEHVCTKKVEYLLNYIKEDRTIALRSWSLRGSHGNFYALRYVDDGKGCLVQGPIAQPSRCKDKEKTFTVPTNDIIPHWGGTPVIWQYISMVR